MVKRLSSDELEALKGSRLGALFRLFSNFSYAVLAAIVALAVTGMLIDGGQHIEAVATICVALAGLGGIGGAVTYGQGRNYHLAGRRRNATGEYDAIQLPPIRRPSLEEDARDVADDSGGDT